MRKLYYRLYLDSVDGFITVSRRIRKDILSYIQKPVEVVRPFPVYTYDMKTEINKNILFIGNESIEKGFLYLVEAMKYLPEYGLYLVGNCCKKVRTKLSNVYLEGKVLNLKKYFKNCFYYIHPADFDPCPITVFEAMYNGLIPIITKNVGQAEIFLKNLTNLILKNNEPKTIANKVLEISNYAESNKQKISNLCKKIAEKYTKEKSVKRFKKAFYQLI